MIDYTALFESMRRRAATFTSDAGEEPCVAEEEDPRLDADETAEFVEEFCLRAGRHVEEIGADAVGDLVWYLMGQGEAVWWDVVTASHAYAEDAILSLRNHYEHCFAVHLDATGTQDEEEGPLATACHMLWDMGAGLETIPMFQKPKALVPACYEVLEHALALDSHACWKSALHGLGHIAFSKPDPARSLIDTFLATKQRSIPADLREYALSARCGSVQ